MGASAAQFQFGPFSERFEKIETLSLDPGFSFLLAKDRKTQDLVRLQLLHLPTLEGKESLPGQWEAIKACRDFLWLRPQEWLEKNHYGILISWVPPGRHFSQIHGTLHDETYLRWMKEALKDLAQLHRLGLLHLAQNEKSWILFKADEEKGEEILGLSDVGLLTEVPLGQKVLPEAMVAVAPEILKGNPVDARADLYSLACLILRQRSEKSFQNFDSLKKNLELHWQGRMVEFVPESSSALNDLLRKMLQPDPLDRPAGALELLQELDPYAAASEESAPSLPSWASQRIRARQNTLILNTIHTLVDHGESELSVELLDTLADNLVQDHEVYLRYLQARAGRLKGEKEEAKEFRRQATVKSYSQPDPKLKTLLSLEEARVCLEENKMKEALKFLDQAWETIKEYPESNLQVRVLYERGRVKKDLGKDPEALEELQKAYERIPEGEPHSWKAEVYAELAEILTAYGRPRSALPLVEDALAVPEEDVRARARRLVQAALVQVALGVWDRATQYFSQAKDLYSSQKDLKSLIWASAQEVRLYIAKGDMSETCRKLKALKSRNRGRHFHSELLNLLEIRYWLESGKNLGLSTQKLVQELRRSKPENFPGGFFRDLGWPIPETCRLYEQTFQKFRQFSESAAFAKPGAELEVALGQNLKKFGYQEEEPVRPLKEIAPATPVKVESLLHRSGESQSEEMGRETPQPGEMEKLREQLSQLEQRLKEQEGTRLGLLRENARQAREIRDLQRQLESKISAKLQTRREVEAASLNRRETPAVPVPKTVSSPEQGVENASGKSLDREVIQAALEKHKGNKSLAAKELGVHRRTLFQKIKKYGLENLEFLPGKEEILAALELCQGKKAEAAQQLGLSRSSFYRRLKDLGIH